MCDLPTETEQSLHQLCHLILAAHCDCMAGLGESRLHIAAVLFKIEAAVMFRYTSSACNDEPHRWDSCFVKKFDAASVASKQFYKEPEKERLRHSKDMKSRQPAMPPGLKISRKSVHLLLLAPRKGTHPADDYKSVVDARPVQRATSIASPVQISITARHR